MAATNFSKLRAYAHAKGVEVERSGTYACWDRSTRKIHIPRAVRGRDAVYTLMHEIGHVLVDENGKFDVDVEVHEHAPTWRGRTLCVIEEWEAWEAGRRLAARLGIVISDEHYRRYAASYVAGYVHAAGASPFGQRTSATVDA